MENVKNLEGLREAYQHIRGEGLATGITINTMVGDYPIRNPQVVTAVLDFLIREVNDQIKKEVE